MSHRCYQHKEEEHEKFKLGYVLTPHHLDNMQTRGHTYEVILTYTGQRWKDFLNLYSPQGKGRKPPLDRTSSSTEVMDTDEAERTTTLILGQALANQAGASSVLVTHSGQAGSYLPYILVWNTLVRKFDTFRPMLGVQTHHMQCASVLLSIPALQPHTLENKR